MTLVQYTIVVLGILLETLIVWRCLRERLWRHYPFFCGYMGYVFIRSLAIPILMQLSATTYAKVYWQSQIISLTLQCLIVWEIFRHAFLFSPNVRRLAGRALLILLLLLSAVLVASNNPGRFYPNLERKVDLTQAVLVTAMILCVYYYAIPLSRNIWGMALGFGINLSISVTSHAAFDLLTSFFPLWRLALPLGFLGMLVTWTWALWSYTPNPGPAPALVQESRRHLAGWRHAWSQMRGALRKATKP